MSKRSNSYQNRGKAIELSQDNNLQFFTFIKATYFKTKKVGQIRGKNERNHQDFQHNG